jgi:methionyl aminopeptidase
MGEVTTTFQDWVDAGKIAADVREWSKQLVKPGVSYLDLAQKIEGRILDKEALLGFPVNISGNECAAHDTALPNDDRVLKDEVVKIDIGVCVNGAIGDTAHTVDLSGKNGKLVEASEKALANVMDMIAMGVTLGEIGKVVEDTIVGLGFQPIRNLSGHGLSPWQVHVSPTVPNFASGDTTPLQKGQIIAIEPFATTGQGKIKDGGSAIIYEEMQEKPVRDQFTRKVLRKIQLLEGMPFATRHLVSDDMQLNRVLFALRTLKLNGNIQAHAPLVEVDGGLVSQAEHTFHIDDEITVLTK